MSKTSFSSVAERYQTTSLAERWAAFFPNSEAHLPVTIDVADLDPRMTFTSFCSHAIQAKDRRDTYQFALSLDDGKTTFHSTNVLTDFLPRHRPSLEGGSLVFSGAKAYFMTEKMARLAMADLASVKVDLTGLNVTSIFFADGELLVETDPRDARASSGRVGRSREVRVERWPTGTTCRDLEPRVLYVQQDPSLFLPPPGRRRVGEEETEEELVAAYQVAISAAEAAPTGDFPCQEYRIPLPLGLSDLVLTDNKLEALDLTGAPATLRRVACSLNPLRALKGVPETLHTLECQACLLEELPAMNVEVLWCFDNLLTSLPRLPYAREVFCYNNRITHIPVDLKCEMLWAHNNPIVEAPTNALTSPSPRPLTA